MSEVSGALMLAGMLGGLLVIAVGVLVWYVRETHLAFVELERLDESRCKRIRLLERAVAARDAQLDHYDDLFCDAMKVLTQKEMAEIIGGVDARERAKEAGNAEG